MPSVGRRRSPRTCSSAHPRAGGCGSITPPRYCRRGAMMTNEDTPERVTSRETDRLAVLGIEAFGHHGVFDFERREGQVFKADLVLGIDTRDAARTDDLQHTVDYGSLVSKVKKAIESDPVDLIETLAQ